MPHDLWFSEKDTCAKAGEIYSALLRLGKRGATKEEIRAYWDSTEPIRRHFAPTKMGSCIYTLYEEIMGLTKTRYYWPY